MAVTALFTDRGPRRVLGWATFVNLIGTGIFINTSALFFTRAVGLPVARVGLGLTVSGVIGLVASVPAGHLADRWGPRRAWVSGLCGEAVLMSAFVFVRSFWPFLAVMCLSQVAAAASSASRAPVIRRLGGDEPARLQAHLRAVGNLASSLGLVIAAIAVQVDTRLAYLMLVIINAVSFAGCALVVLALPRLAPLPAPPGAGRWIALRDRPYTTLAALECVMALQYPVLAFALPLWIVDHTSAPRWMGPAGAFLNTVLVVFLQVKASRGVNSPQAAGRATRTASLVLFTAFVLAASAAGLPALPAALILVAAYTVQTLGEVRQAAAAFELTFALAPPHAQGQYAGLFGMGSGLAFAIGPSVLGFLCLGLGRPGWLTLGGLLVAAGFVTPAVIRWAERTR